MEYAQLVIVAILIEAIWENLKMIWQNGKLSIDKIGALVISVLICILAKIDIFPIVNLSVGIPVIGSIFTGIIVSRGANFVHDLFNKISGDKEVK
nr:hypothetical protein XLIUZIGB_XLIUZIGB_CDS_0041 [Caudoviricetes sp.]